MTQDNVKLHLAETQQDVEQLAGFIINFFFENGTYQL